MFQKIHTKILGVDNVKHFLVYEISDQNSLYSRIHKNDKFPCFEDVYCSPNPVAQPKIRQNSDWFFAY
jgi:hypothetical protein